MFGIIASKTGGMGMSFTSLASNASMWRGYEYYEEKKVLNWRQVEDYELEGAVWGSDPEAYLVHIDVKHPKKSLCNCAHAIGNMKICKHKMALFFTIFPKEAEAYLEEIEAYERNEEDREKAHYAEIVKHVKSLSKEELRTALIDAIVEAEQRDRRRY